MEEELLTTQYWITWGMVSRQVIAQKVGADQAAKN